MRPTGRSFAAFAAFYESTTGTKQATVYLVSHIPASNGSFTH